MFLFPILLFSYLFCRRDNFYPLKFEFPCLPDGFGDGKKNPFSFSFPSFFIYFLFLFCSRGRSFSLFFIIFVFRCFGTIFMKISQKEKKIEIEKKKEMSFVILEKNF